MKKYQRLLSPFLLTVILVSKSPALLHGEDAVVALGAVASNGTLDNSANSVEGVVASSLNGTGTYDITVTAAGAFAGTTPGDYTVETTIRAVSSDDNLSNGAVTSVTNDVLTIRVRTSDVEDTANPNGPLAQDSAFFFLIRRVVAGDTSLDGDSRFLLGVGKVALDGTLISGFGVDGVTVTATRPNTGEYFINLTKPGGFAGDAADDYLLFVTPDGGSSVDDEAIRGGATAVVSDDTVLVEVYTDDVQQGVAGNNPTPTNEPFHFSIYRLTGAETSGQSASRLVRAVASIDSTGGLTSGATRFGEGAVTASRLGAGLFQLDLSLPGGFTGASSNRFVVHAFDNSSNASDELVGADVSVFDDNTLRVQISATDVEADGEATGTLNDRNLFVVIYDTDPAFGPDLGIGTKKSLSSMNGIGVINGSGAGQGIKLNLTGTFQRKFFVAAENAGHSTDSLRLKGIATRGPLDTKFFRTTGGKTNVTAEVKIGSVVAEDFYPGNIVRFEGLTAYKSQGSRPTKTMKVRGISDFAPASVDLVKVKTVAN